jgi:hypothetical protein
MFYYFKKAKKVSFLGALTSAIVGVVFIVVIQKVVIAGIPNMWAWFDMMMVNNFGLPFYSGIIPVILLFTAGIWYGLHYARKTNNGLMQRLVVSFAVIVIAYSCYGMVILRAIASPPINMNDPSDPMRLLPYLNREQYGERPLLSGPDFDAPPVGVESTERYGRVGNRYEVVDEKVDYEFSPNDKTLFPRMGDYSQDRPRLYRQWIDKPTGKPTFSDNIEFFWKYQIGWMYWRYFMWNFSGRQNGEQGYYSWDPTAGNWITGFSALDERRIGNQREIPDFQKYNQANNKYYLIPFLLGLLGMFFHYSRRRNDFFALFALFIITGVGIIVYSNQPPNEPRERDYVLAGSFFKKQTEQGRIFENLYRFIKADVEIKHIRSYQKSSLHLRAYAGAGLALNTSSRKGQVTLPFFKSFIAGGPNSMRGWSIRKLGIGSNIFFDTVANGRFNDKYADIQLEGNIEYRFNLFPFYGFWMRGAVFSDIGNIWFRDNLNGSLPGSGFKLNKLGKDIAIASGFGARIDFSYFLLRFDLGFPVKDPRYGPENKGNAAASQFYADKAGGWFVQDVWNKPTFQFAIGYPF